MSSLEARVEVLEQQVAGLLKELSRSVTPSSATTVTVKPLAIKARVAVLNGVRLSTGDTVLVKHQIDPQENGLYRLNDHDLLEKVDTE